jgi:protease secretion system outer membrane protein
MSRTTSNLDIVFSSCKSLLFASLTVISLNSEATTLDDAVQSAMKYDLALRSSKLNQLAAVENISVMRSRLLPQINLQGTSSQLSQTTIQELPNGGSSTRTFAGPAINHQLVLKQAIFKTKEISSITIAVLQADYAELKLKYETEDLKSRVISSWLDFLGAKQVVAAWTASLQLTESALKQEIAKYSKGESTKDFIAEVNGQAQNINGNYLQAVENLKSKRRTLENLTKISIELNTEEIMPLDLEEEFTENKKNLLLRKHILNSLEQKMSKVQLAIQLERVKLTGADHKPTLDLLATFNLARNDATSTQGYQYKNKQIGIQYVIPIFAGGGLEAADKQALLSYEASLLDNEIVTNRIINEFEINWSVLVGSSHRKKGLLELFKGTEEQLLATKRGYELGIKTISDLANIQQSHSRRLVELINATQEYYKIMYKIKKEIYK